MAVFRLNGSYESGPNYGAPSGEPDIIAPLAEILALRTPGVPGVYELSGDAAVSVGFGALGTAGVIIIKTSGKIRVRLTSADGATQAIPVDSLLVLLARSVPVTAIDLTRVAGVATSVKVFLGECS